MPDTYSKNKRTKRPDFRPNGKQRRKEKQAVAAATPVEELIKTKIPRSKRKERHATGFLKPGPNEITNDPDRKRSRALQKLLRQIEGLAQKATAGETLDQAQREKLGRFEDVVAELEELMGSEEECNKSEGEVDKESVEDIAENNKVHSKRQRKR